ncbi:MAG: LPS assembly lipoprotein LptE [Roseiarcus sp.]|jgi:LPS-assembly lipoprotein
MSWSDRARVAAALLMALGLGGCFQPLYGEASHPGLVEDMRAVEVAPIKDRIGHYLGEDLISNLNGSGETPPAKYRLVVTMAVNSQTPTISSQINAANAATVIGKATFTLTKIEGGAVIYKSEATSAAVYDRTLDSFANLRAARDAEIRIARSLADEIELRVAAALGDKR